ncbi:DUF3450 domain-containing protein [Luteithermobacter gelatinilyticus]|uniref:DUF3450 domain-containing protein n=1 Tax=Luteithermobacter gelatinilyticus TaxID=2582913 RepID=UPI0011069BC3|nr:DUF3450 domain-containing protein [Luteithermobacter gelatinilyticus]|tara:strand:- start:6635 stop:7420 length:786 start_codon:yes stop_codon:yes gene_type:complete
MNKHRVRTLVLSAVAAGALMMGAGTAGATELKEVLDEGMAINKLAQESQKRIDKIVEETDKIVSQYKAVQKTIEGLKIYNAQLQRQIDRQVEEMEDLSTSIKQVTYVKRQITPLMLKMVDALEAFIKMDVPFQLNKRLEGIERLKDLMDDPSVDTSEKFRSVFEAYQIESDYGRALVAYTDTIEIDGVSREVDFLQVGRVALVYQTRDGQITGAWNNQTKQFEILDDSYRSSVAQALRVANKQAAADRLLKLPILAPERAQ